MKCLDEDDDKNKGRSEMGIWGERIRNNACQVVLLPLLSPDNIVGLVRF